MKQNDFYEVDGCMNFIPVTINETYADSVDVTVNSITHTFRMAVKQVYRFQKPHEPQKPVIPKYVAEWLEHCKQCNLDLQMTLSRLDDDDKIADWAYDENDNLISEKAEIFARAWLDGYEVDKEKLYTVEIKGISSGKLFKNIQTNKYLFHSGNGLKGYTDKLTETEIKQKDERLLQFAKEVDI